MVIVGIDNGLDGGIVVLKDGKVEERWVMPTIGTTGSKRVYDTNEMCDMMHRVRELAGEGLLPHVFLENAQAFPGQGVSSTFSTGFGFGLWQGILSALSIPFTVVRPQAWQKVMFEGINHKDTKQASAVIASRLLPGVDWKASERSRTPHDGLTDAACIALYGSKSMTNKN